MGLKLGNTTIGSLYLGSTKIAQAYLGSTKIYQATTPVVSYPYLTMEFDTGYTPTTNLLYAAYRSYCMWSQVSSNRWDGEYLCSSAAMSTDPPAIWQMCRASLSEAIYPYLSMVITANPWTVRSLMLPDLRKRTLIISGMVIRPQRMQRLHIAV